jgi:hypothetical protein
MQPGMVVHAYNPSTQEVEARESQVQSLGWKRRKRKGRGLKVKRQDGKMQL